MEQNKSWFVRFLPYWCVSSAVFLLPALGGTAESSGLVGLVRAAMVALCGGCCLGLVAFAIARRFAR